MPLNTNVPQAADFFKSDGTGLSAAGFRYLAQLGKTAEAINKLGKSDAFVDDISGEIAFPEDGTYTIILDSKVGRAITEVTVKTSAGSATVTPKIGSTTLGGGASAATTSKSTVAHESDNALGVNDTLVFVLSSTSNDCEKLSFTLKLTKALQVS